MLRWACFWCTSTSPVEAWNDPSSLHGKKRGCPALPWPVRYKVAVGIAEAIDYLLNGTERCVVHRDIKPSNILVSSKKTPKLCDFGLATWTPGPSVPFLCKMVKGTFGYLALEYFQHGKVSDKTDVYAFGVVLLELITGRKPIESSRGPGEDNLVQWMLNNERETIGDSIDVTKVTPHEDDKGHEKNRSSSIDTWKFDQEKAKKALAFRLIVDELRGYVNFVG